MKLKTKLMLVTTFAVLVILGASEWIGYSRMAALVNGHEAAMSHGGDHSSFLAALEQGKRGLFRSSLILHLTHALPTVLGFQPPAPGASFEAVGSSCWTDSGTNPVWHVGCNAKAIENRDVT